MNNVNAMSNMQCMSPMTAMNAMQGMCGVNGMQGMNTMQGMSGMQVMGNMNGMTCMPAIQGMQGIPGMLPMGIGPNSMMAGLMMGNALMQNTSTSKQPSPEATNPTLEMDPDVSELGDYFQIEERWIKRLNETIAKRKDTKASDLAKLWEVLEQAYQKTRKNPTGLLTVKIGEMESGQFVGKVKPDKDVRALSKKFKLDEHVESRLIEIVVRRKETRDVDLARLEKLLHYSKRPSGLVMILAGKLLDGDLEALPELTEAEELMKTFKLDNDACSKLAEIVLKRANSEGCYPQEVLTQLRRHLEVSLHPSAMLCKLAGKIIDGEALPEPIERKPAAHGAGRITHEKDRDKAHNHNRDFHRDMVNDLRRDTRDRDTRNHEVREQRERSSREYNDQRGSHDQDRDARDARERVSCELREHQTGGRERGHETLRRGRDHDPRDCDRSRQHSRERSRGSSRDHRSR